MVTGVQDLLIHFLQSSYLRKMTQKISLSSEAVVPVLSLRNCLHAGHLFVHVLSKGPPPEMQVFNPLSAPGKLISTCQWKQTHGLISSTCAYFVTEKDHMLVQAL